MTGDIPPGTRRGRGFYVGLAIGQLWLVLISTAGASFAWVIARTQAEVAAILAIVALVGLALLGGAALLLRLALGLAADGSADETARGRAIGIRFGLVVLLEAAIIGAVNVLLSMTGNSIWSVPFTELVVGIHFVPLAFVFGVRPYVVLGVLWVLVVIATVLTTSPGGDIGQGLSPWLALPIAGCGVATWVVVAYVLVDSLRRIRSSAGATRGLHRN